MYAQGHLGGKLYGPRFPEYDLEGRGPTGVGVIDGKPGQSPQQTLLQAGYKGSLLYV